MSERHILEAFDYTQGWKVRLKSVSRQRGRVGGVLTTNCRKIMIFA